MPGRYKGLPAPLRQSPSNCLSSIWTPETWPFYSLCFPCFSPFLISFCSASKSLHPSELREGWCVFTFWTQHKTEIISWYVCHKESHLTEVQVKIQMHYHGLLIFFFPFFKNLYWYCFYLCRTFNVHVPIENDPGPCLTVQKVVHVCIFEVGW